MPTPDLIDRNELRKHNTYMWDEAIGHEPCVFMEDIDKAPAVDAVPVVRCRECKHRGNEYKCPMLHVECYFDDTTLVDDTADDGFCYKGERKEDDHAAD